MSKSLFFTKGAAKETVYEELLPQIEALLSGESDVIANLANLSAVLREAFGFFWVGFYLVREEHLVLGPFQGSLACTRIAKGKGVCGTAWAQDQTLIVPDVELFEGHIACSSLSRSEIVVPVRNRGKVVAVLDVDSDRVEAFDETDALFLERITALLRW